MRSILQKAVWLIILVPALYLWFIWDSIPARVIMQYDLQGNPLRYGSRSELVIMLVILTVVNILTYFLLTNVHRMEPRKKALANKDRLQRIAFAVALFIAAVQCVLFQVSTGGNVSFSISLIIAAVGLLFAFIGNYMPNLKPNYYAGFRLPWTLENEENWRKTHQLAGKVWFAGGLIIAIGCLFIPAPLSLVFFFIVLAIIVIIPFRFSYRMYKEQKNKN